MAARDFPAPTTRRNKLSSGELRALWQRNSTPEVRELLWEIYRLQDVARKAQSMVTQARMWGIDKPFLVRLDALDAALFAEPCLWERPLAWSTDETLQAMWLPSISLHCWLKVNFEWTRVLGDVLGRVAGLLPLVDFRDRYL